MFGGQSIGIAAATALSGFAIARLGPAAAYLLSASFIGAITLYMLLLTERPGERLTIAMFAALMALSAAMWFSVANWGEPSYFTAFVYAWYGLDVLITVVALPISMRLCDLRVAATQFTLYMATANFGISIAAWVLGFSRQSSGLPMMFVVVFALHLVGLMLVVLVKFPRRMAVVDVVAARQAEREGLQPVIN